MTIDSDEVLAAFGALRALKFTDRHIVALCDDVLRVNPHPESRAGAEALKAYVAWYGDVLQDIRAGRATVALPTL